MPIYEYRCKSCGHALEVRARMSDPPQTLCPACGAEQLQKQVSRTSFQLKGGGWYASGYSSGKGGADAKGDSTATGGTGAATSATTTGDKPATTAPAAESTSTPAAPTAPTSTPSSGTT